MKNIRIFLSENLHFLVVKFSIYLNRRVFVMSNDLRISMVRSKTAQVGTHRCNNVDSMLIQRLDVESDLFQGCVRR